MLLGLRRMEGAWKHLRMSRISLSTVKAWEEKIPSTALRANPGKQHETKSD
jgi:hypothetical protein